MVVASWWWWWWVEVVVVVEVHAREGSNLSRAQAAVFLRVTLSDYSSLEARELSPAASRKKILSTLGYSAIRAQFEPNSVPGGFSSLT